MIDRAGRQHRRCPDKRKNQTEDERETDRSQDRESPHRPSKKIAYRNAPTLRRPSSADKSTPGLCNRRVMLDRLTLPYSRSKVGSEMSDALPLTGTVAVVTGASRGVGKGVALGLGE